MLVSCWLRSFGLHRGGFGAICARSLATALLPPVRGRQALADDLLDLFAAQLGDLLRRFELLQGGERGADGVDRVVGAVRLGEDVLDAGGLDDRAHGATGDDARSWSGGLQH